MWGLVDMNSGELARKPIEGLVLVCFLLEFAEDNHTLVFRTKEYAERAAETLNDKQHNRAPVFKEDLRPGSALRHNCRSPIGMP